MTRTLRKTKKNRTCSDQTNLSPPLNVLMNVSVDSFDSLLNASFPCRCGGRHGCQGGFLAAYFRSATPDDAFFSDALFQEKPQGEEGGSFQILQTSDPVFIVENSTNIFFGAGSVGRVDALSQFRQLVGNIYFFLWGSIFINK